MTNDQLINSVEGQAKSCIESLEMMLGRELTKQESMLYTAAFMKGHAAGQDFVHQSLKGIIQ